MISKTEGKMITAYQRMVIRMKFTALGLKHHWLDNTCSVKFKQCITKNRMTHKLVPPDCHHCNITKWAIQTLFFFDSIIKELRIGFPSPCGAISCNQLNIPSIYSNRATLHQKCPRMPMSMGNMTT